MCPWDSMGKVQRISEDHKAWISMVFIQVVYGGRDTGKKSVSSPFVKISVEDRAQDLLDRFSL